MNRWTRAILRTGPDLEKQNMVWNMAGSFCYAFASMVLSFLVMRIAGEEQGGVFAFGYSTLGQQLFLLAYFGIRPFQITDGGNQYRFGDYLHLRYLTCILALIGGGVYLLFIGYTPQKATILFLLVGYKVIDGFADVYESEFQRNGKLYLTGKSNTFRTILSVAAFLLVLLGSKNLLVACVAAVGAQLAGLLLFDVMILKCLDGVDYSWNKNQVRNLVAATILLFISVFLDFYIFSASKYAIDAHMGDASSGYFNVIFMPTSVINLAAGFVIRPFLTHLTIFWQEKRWKNFADKILRLGGIILGLTVLAVGATALIGKPVLSILETLLGSAYEGKLTVYAKPFIWIVLGGGFYGFLNLYYYVLVIMRRQKTIFAIYLVMTVLAVYLAPRLVTSQGIPGAAMAYLILMIVMAIAFTVCAWSGFYKEKNKGGEGR